MYHQLRIMPISSLQDCIHLQSDLSRVSQSGAIIIWNLFLNEKKCSTVHYMPCLSTTFNYHLNGQQIPSKAMEKDMGLIVSADFNWRPHYQSITSRAYKVLGLLRRIFSGSVSVSAKCSLYTSLVRSQLLYCSPVRHPYLLRDIRCLELVQRRATKFIL